MVSSPRLGISLVGPYPPPFGGVSVHIQRLIPYLEKAGINYTVFNQYSYGDTKKRIVATNRRVSWWLKFLFQPQAKITHFHMAFSIQIFYFALFSLFHPLSCTLVTVHNEKLLKVPRLYFQLLIWILKVSKVRMIICVSKKVHERIAMGGVNSIYLPAYIPPVSPAKSDWEWNDVEKNIFFSIWKIDSKETLDIYGFDLMIELAKLHGELLFHVFLGDKSNLILVSSIVQKFGLSNVRIHIGKNLSHFLKYCNIMLRLNRFDAYGVSIQEAVDSKVFSIASDVCKRPDGAFLFENENLVHLLELFSMILSGKHQLPTSQKPKYHLDLIGVYKKHLDC